MRIIVCGGRGYEDFGTVKRVLAHLGHQPIIVHGAAPGADTLADIAAYQLGLPVESWTANWTRHGKAAGPIRNQAMLDAGADLVIAFPGGRGTEDMVARAVKAGVPTLRVQG